MNKQDRLAHLRNRATRYEITAKGPDGEFLVGYTARKTRRGMLEVMRMYHGNLIHLCDTNEMTVPSHFKAKDGIVMGDWTIKFSGRTQRDAISNGELDRLVGLVGNEQS